MFANKNIKIHKKSMSYDHKEEDEIVKYKNYLFMNAISNVIMLGNLF